MAMDLCVDEKDEERESEAQAAVRPKKRAEWGGRGGARFFALTSDWASLSRSSSFSSMQRSIAISLSMFSVVHGRFVVRLFVVFVGVALRAASILKNHVFWYQSKKTWFPFLLMLPCGRPRFWKIVFFCIDIFFFTLQNCLICLVLSIGSMLVFLVLKNAVECTSQRLKWTSGARVMTIFNYFIYKWSFSLCLDIGSVLELLVLKNGAERTSQRLKWTSGARVMIVFGHSTYKLSFLI